MVEFRVSHAVHDVKRDDGEKECDDEDFHDALIIGWFLSIFVVVNRGIALCLESAISATHAHKERKIRLWVVGWVVEFNDSILG
jgi:hypothetical protein